MLTSEKAKSEKLTAENARDSIALVLAEKKSAATGKKIKL
jgi:hypothetical protein